MKNAFTLAEGAKGTFPLRKFMHAFTLAEVLITLGIIGIIAALTMPSLIAKYQKQQTVVKLKRIYTVLNTAMKRAEADFGDYSSWDDAYDMGAEKYFDTYIKPYIRISKECSTKDYCGYKSNAPWKLITGENSSTSLFYDAKGAYLMETGEYICFRVRAGENEKNSTIFVDLNGPKEPNQFGKDVFILVRTPDNGIQANGYTEPENNINYICRTSGTLCAAKIIFDGWEIKDDYPW